MVEVVAAAGVVRAEEDDLLAVGQPRGGAGTPLGVAADQQRAVGADAFGGPQFGAVVDVRVRVGGEGVRDDVPVGGVGARVPGRLGGVAGRPVADPGLRAALGVPYVHLPSPYGVAVAGVREACAVRGPGRGVLVVGGVGEPAQAGAVDADRPEVALDAAAGAGLGRVEHHGPPVRGEFGAGRVPVRGEPAHRAVRAAHVHLGPGAVAQAGEDEDAAAGGGVLVVVGGPVTEEGLGADRVAGRLPEAAVFGAGEGDAPRLVGRRVGGGDRVARPVGGRGGADQQRRQQHHRTDQPGRPGTLRRASSAGHGPPHSLSMTLHRPASRAHGARDRPRVPGTGEATVALCGAGRAGLGGVGPGAWGAGRMHGGAGRGVGRSSAGPGPRPDRRPDPHAVR